MATLSVAVTDESGVNAGLVAASAGGDEFPNNGSTLLIVRNGGGSAINVTITAQVTSAAQAADPTVGALGKVTKANQVLSVGAGVTAVFGPFPPSAFNNVNGRVAVTYSGVTSVTVGAVRYA